MESKLISQKQLILARVSQGDFLKDIGKDLGVTAQQVGWIANTHFKDEYLAAKESGIETRLDTATARLDEIAENAGKEGNNYSISESYCLARIYAESLKRAEWRASVELPGKYGNHPSVNISIGTETSAALESDARSLVAKIKPKT